MCATAGAQEVQRPWDQEKALELTRGVIRLEEEQGQPWDKIPWMTDPAKAAARMKKEGKPALVYYYLEKGGPKAAPC